jgi:hypothetical protein
MVYCCIQWFEVGGGCLFSTVVFNDLRWEVVVCFLLLYSMIWGGRWLFVFYCCIQWFEVGGGCLFSTVVFNDLRWEVVVCFLLLYSMIWGGRWLFVLLILVKLLTITVQIIFSEVYFYVVFIDFQNDPAVFHRHGEHVWFVGWATRGTLKGYFIGGKMREN